VWWGASSTIWGKNSPPLASRALRGRLAEEGSWDTFLELSEQALRVVTLELLEALGYRHHYPPSGKWRLF